MTTARRDPVAAILDASLATPGNSARAVMRLSLLDWAACGIAGRDEPVATLARALAAEEDGAAQATLFGGGRAPARMAALVNGAASHALDYDDTHFAHIGHPSVAVLPAALAMAEKTGAGFDALLAAALAGCEASIRFGVLFGRAHYQVGFHQTATAGAFGATVAAAKLLGLDRDGTGQALGLVSTRASGLKAQFGTMGKPFNAGIAAANGVEAASLAALGFISSPGAIAGQNGFLETHHCDGATVTADGFLMEGVSHKFHACCHGLHAMLETLATLPVSSADAVTAVQVQTHPRWLTVCDQPAPSTGLGAKFSYRTAAALALLGHDTAALATWSDTLARDPRVVALRDRVHVAADPGLTETQANVALTTADGVSKADYDLDSPLALAERRARVEAKARALLDPHTSAALIAAVESGDGKALCRLVGAAPQTEKPGMRH
jgi:2-methylcitrate dehydratase PrpD